MTWPISDAELDREIGRALRAVSAAGTKADFRATVLARAERAAARRTRRLRQGIAAVAGACVLAIGVGVWSFEVAAERASRRATLLDEHRRLQDELEELRALAGRRSRIALGGDASTDLYLDLTTIPASAAGGGTTATTRSSG